MKISRFRAVALGFMSVVPLAAIVLFLAVVFPQATAGPVPVKPSFMMESVILFIVGLLAMGFYVAFVWRSRRVPEAEKGAWSSRIIFGSLVAMPIFWYLYIWKDRPLEKHPTLDEYISGAA